MSHFTVLVIGENPEDLLQPFHEFECTGIDDQYVVDADETVEARAAYEKRSKRLYRSPAGEDYDAYDDRFFRDPTPEEQRTIGPLAGTGAGSGLSWSSKDWDDGLGYRAKIHFLPEGWQEVDVNVSKFQTFAEFCNDYYGRELMSECDYQLYVIGEKNLSEKYKYGYIVIDKNNSVVKVVNRTNEKKWRWFDATGVVLGETIGDAMFPQNGVKTLDNGEVLIAQDGPLVKPAQAAYKVLIGGSKWDWYQIGGRWSGFFKLKVPYTGKIGELTLLAGKEQRDEWRKKHGTYADQARKKDIDWETMRLEAEFEAGEKYDKLHGIWKKHPEYKSWKQVLAEFGDEKIDDARKFYNNQPALKEFRDAEFYFFDDDVESFNVPREEYTSKAGKRSFTTFAVLYHNEWYEKGSMGWFGCASDEMDQETWNTKVYELLCSASEDTLLTLVDCHI